MQYVAMAIVMMCIITCTLYGCLKAEELLTRFSCKEAIYTNRPITMEERSFCNKLAEARTFGFKKDFHANGKQYTWDRENDLFIEKK